MKTLLLIVYLTGSGVAVDSQVVTLRECQTVKESMDRIFPYTYPMAYCILMED